MPSTTASTSVASPWPSAQAPSRWTRALSVGVAQLVDGCAAMFRVGPAARRVPEQRDQWVIAGQMRAREQTGAIAAPKRLDLLDQGEGVETIWEGSCEVDDESGRRLLAARRRWTLATMRPAPTLRDRVSITSTPVSARSAASLGPSTVALRLPDTWTASTRIGMLVGLDQAR